MDDRVSLFLITGDARLRESLGRDLSRDYPGLRLAPVRHELADGVALLRSILDAIPDALLVVDTAGRVLAHNHRLLEIWRLEPHSGALLDQESFLDAIRPGLLDPSVLDRAASRMVERAGEEERTPLRLADGRLLTLHALPRRVDDRVVGRIWAFQDVTDARHTAEALREREGRVHMIVEQLPACLWTTDRDLKITLSEGAGLAGLGLAPGQLVGAHLKDYLGSDDPAWQPYGAHLRALAGESHTFQTRWQGRTFQSHVEPLLDAEGRVAGALGLAIDITEHVEAARALEESERRFRLLFERNLAGVYRSTPDGRFLDCNDACARVFGYGSRQELLDASAVSLYTTPEERELFVARLREQRSLTNHESRHRRRDGREVWTLENVTLLHGEDGGEVLEGTIIDISDRKQAEERVRYQAYHDALTGLPNRALLVDRLNLAIAQAGRRRSALAVLCLDLDQFKVINDSLGHPFGDRVLQAVAERLTGCLRAGDTVARSGGDEFIVLAPELPRAEDVIGLAQGILNQLALPFRLDAEDLYLTTSIGIAVHPTDGGDAESLLKNGDAALYRAKETGRNSYQVCTPGLNARAMERLSLESRLRRALDRDELVLHYQPIVDLKSGALVGVEALARWQHPGRGLLLPDEFIPAAEDSRLIVPIGNWVLRTACQQLAAWHRGGFRGLRMAVNLSARQFQHQDVSRSIEHVIEETGIEARCLEIEITESVAMQNAAWTTGVLRAVRGMGVRISIDDFGTGQSSLSYLKHFPLSTVKIDRSFVTDITRDPDDEAIVRAVIALAHSLKLNVVAEGVESPGHVEFLHAAGCEEVQGFFYSRPLPAGELLALLRDWPPAAAGR